MSDKKKICILAQNVFCFLVLSTHKLFFVMMRCFLSVHKLTFCLLVSIHAQTVCFFIRAQTACCCGVLFVYPCANRLVFCCVAFLYPYTNCMLVWCVVFFIHVQTVCFSFWWCFVSETNCDLSLSVCFSFRFITSSCVLSDWL